MWNIPLGVPSVCSYELERRRRGVPFRHRLAEEWYLSSPVLDSLSLPPPPSLPPASLAGWNPLLQSTEQLAASRDSGCTRRPTAFTREMADTPKITHTVHGDPETLPQFPQSETSRSTLLRLVDPFIEAVKRLAYTARLHLFFSAFILYGILIAMVAGLTKRYYNKDIRFGGQDIPYDSQGVSFPLVSLARLDLN